MRGHFQDPGGRVDIGCGVLVPLRISRFAAVLEYAHDNESARHAVDQKSFEFHNVVLTTRGRWQLRGEHRKVDVDSESLVLGVQGAQYGCRHYGCAEDRNLIVALRAGALDPEFGPLFARQIVPAGGAAAIVGRALRCETEDAFESIVFALFDDLARASNRERSGVRVQAAKRFIERHAFEALRIADVAQAVGLSPFVLIRQFRSGTGLSPYAYVLSLRAERAKALLAKTDAPIRTIAAQCGFANFAHFSAFFKRCAGTSPSSFRRIVRIR